MASHGSDTPTSPRAVLHHKDTILCTFMHTTVVLTNKCQRTVKTRELELQMLCGDTLNFYHLTY